MSARVDSERAEAAREARIEAGKERLRLAQAVLTAYADGLGLADTARRLAISKQRAWRVRVWLGIQPAKCRRDARRVIEEIQP